MANVKCKVEAKDFANKLVSINHSHHASSKRKKFRKSKGCVFMFVLTFFCQSNKNQINVVIKNIELKYVNEI